MHRADVIRIMDEQGLKLVLLSELKDPPVYQLMSGKQIHEEQLKLRDKQKAKAGTSSDLRKKHIAAILNSVIFHIFAF